MRSSIQILRVIITNERALGERARPSPSWSWWRARPCHRCSYHLGRAFLFGGAEGGGREPRRHVWPVYDLLRAADP